MRRIYLDHAATTPVLPDVMGAMLPLMGERFGNPSSVHARGREARAAVDEARDAVAAILGCAPREIVFTGSGTEADNLALRGVLERWGAERGRHLVVSAIEHDAVLETARGLRDSGRADVDVVACDAGCRVDPDDVARLVRPDTSCVSVMLVNNETGTIQPVAAIAEAVHRRNPMTLVHSDAAQALGRIAVDPTALGVDLLTLSAHKAYGPKGVGALWVRHGVHVAAQLSGGGQERGRRSGTESTAAIAGFGCACRLAARRLAHEPGREAALCRRLIDGVVDLVQDAVVTGAAGHRAPGFASFAFPGVRTDVLLTALDTLGVEASGGSACSSGAPTPSHVLVAMGLEAGLAAGALRCTTGVDTTQADVDAAAVLVAAAVAQVRRAPRLSGPG